MLMPTTGFWGTVSWLPEQSHGVYLWVLRFLDVRIRKSEKAIFTSASSDFSGRRVWRFFVPGIPGTVRRRTVFSMSGGKMRGKVLREKPQKLKCLNDEMLDAEECFLILDIYWYLLLHKKCICSRRWTKETSAKMFLMMSSLLHIVYDVSRCVSIFYSSFHDFESCLIHLSSQSSRPPMFVHSNHGPSQRLSAIGKTGATRALWQTSLRIGALRGVSLRCEVDYSVTAV